ncbi:unnamed protein product [Pieris macdunnoughi]|uniref:Uncharacterized protein n=1 Tax=Pieris macdunnoughi TaxID=345717 RepID=A0A821W6E3_9NEOP|nr:unnamed protein product [Pieris macdunnoughi]
MLLVTIKYKGVPQNTVCVLPEKTAKKIPTATTLQAISVPRNNNDVLIRITARDVPFVTANKGGNLQTTCQMFLPGSSYRA